MKMSRISLLALVALFMISLNAQAQIRTLMPTEAKVSKRGAIADRLSQLPGVTVSETDFDEKNFESGYKLMIEQPIDHNDLSKGTFQQKVYLSHDNVKSPMVMFINGYGVGSNARISELSLVLDANQIHVEHRYFGESTPKGVKPGSKGWEYLTVEQAALDHHRIHDLLAQIYKAEWISTGISKGGQTTMYYRKFFPNDVAVAVPYVAPLNLEREDKRIYDFLENVGDAQCRKKVTDYQKNLLENRWAAYPYFIEWVSKQQYVFDFPLDKIYELSILEFSFAFWQWNGDCSKLPPADASIEEQVDFLFEVDAPGFFSEDTKMGIYSFFYQAYRQVGMYGYDIRPFGDLITQYDKTVDNYYTFVPKGIEIDYDGQTMHDVSNWLKASGNNMIYIYGEYDPWSATAFTPSEKTNSVKFVKAAGNHRTRIYNLSEEQRTQLYDLLDEWLKADVDRKVL